MQFIVICEGVPVHVHKHSIPTEKQFLWLPAPARDTAHLFKAGNTHERIYGFLFMLNKEYMLSMDSAQMRNPEWPRELKAFKRIMEMAFKSGMDEYSDFLRDIRDVIPESAMLVTNKGIRSPRVLTFQDSACTTNVVICHKEDSLVTRAYTNILEHQTEALKNDIHSAHQFAIGTGMLGEFYTSQIPNWWHDADSYWSTKSVGEVPFDSKRHPVSGVDAGCL